MYRSPPDLRRKWANVEAFILDFDEDLYGKPVTLEFAGRLRDEEAFSTVDALIRQMNLDVEQTRDLLSGLRRP